jgi:hypothetical protein
MRLELHASFSVQSVRAFLENNMLGTFLLVILILLLVGALPSWGYSTNWWLRTKRILGLVPVVFIVLLVAGRI